MKNKMKACMILLCMLLCGCGASDTETYLMTTQETQIPVESDALLSDTEDVTDKCDAVDAAGGFTRKASRDYWNLAEALTDGQMISFPTEEEAAERRKYDTDGNTSADTTFADSETDGKVNINTADVNQLQQLSGIGQTRAEAIVAYRNEHGAFARVEDIMKVSGIKNALFEKMRDDITVD